MNKQQSITNKKRTINNKNIIKNKNKKTRTYKKHKTHTGGFILSKLGYKIFNDKMKVNLTTKNSYNAKKDAYNDMLNYLIKNSTKKLISYSSLYGLILKMTVSDYYFVDSDGIFIKDFLIKVSFIHDNSSGGIPLNARLDNGQKLPTKRTITRLDFAEEHNVQKEIYLESIHAFGKAIVPDVQFFNIFEELLEQPQRSTFFTGVKDDDDILTSYFNEASKQNVKGIGVFLMKYADNYDVMTNIYSKYYKDQDIRKLSQLVLSYRVHHILLGLLGFVHQDAHGENIMINKDDNSSALIIDFGRIKRINFDPMGIVKRFSLSQATDDTNLELFVNEIIRNIKNNCDIARNSLRIPPKDWPCMKIGQWGVINATQTKQLIQTLQRYLDYFKRTNLRNIPKIERVIQFTIL